MDKNCYIRRKKGIIIKFQHEEELVDSIKLVLNFKFFLKNYGVDTKQFKRLVIAEMEELFLLKKINYIDWVTNAFDWKTEPPIVLNFWKAIDISWRKEVKIAEQNNTTIEFGFYIESDILNFKKFLKQHGRLKDFNTEVLHSKVYCLNKIAHLDIHHWLEVPFVWTNSKDGYNVWYKLNKQWLEQVDFAKDSNIKVVFGFNV